ncbi:MAG: GGDEF domain-containing protein [Burkholderiales bacterium]|nr:GGDEF domain-containing protein [Burkholderiales bacterium]
MWRRFLLLVYLCLALGGLVPSIAHAEQPGTFDALMVELTRIYGTSQRDKDAILDKLGALQPTFTPDQNERYQLVYAHSLGDRGRHAERVALVESFIGQVKTPARRARFLYELIDGYAVLGRYEHALAAMNESIQLLPGLEKTSQKIVALQGAMNLLASLQAYDEALDLADRIYALRSEGPDTIAACAGLTDKVEINFTRGRRELALPLVRDAIFACRANNNEYFVLIVQTLVVIDLVDAGNPTPGITTGLPVLQEFVALNPDSDYIPQLEEALARAYLQTGNMQRAEHFGLRAFERAQSGHIVLLQQKTSETMAAIKRAQGQLGAAIGYYDASLALKKKGLDDQMQKNLAYQRVKFDTQDKANQLALLEQKNLNLAMERTLRERQTESLILLTALGLIVFTGVGAWLARTLGRLDAFRHSAQVDALTQVSNRGHFMARAQRAFKDGHQTISLVLFDMDLFKDINDSYGHATGDWVLKTVCDSVKAHLRKTDLFGRLGGEEFALCLRGLDPEEALTLAERCRIAILSVDTQPTGHVFTITASLGIATRAVGEHTSFHDLLVAADKALYVSKNSGRNRVSVYHPSAAVPTARDERRHRPPRGRERERARHQAVSQYKALEHPHRVFGNMGIVCYCAI